MEIVEVNGWHFVYHRILYQTHHDRLVGIFYNWNEAVDARIAASDRIKERQ